MKSKVVYSAVRASVLGLGLGLATIPAHANIVNGSLSAADPTYTRVASTTGCADLSGFGTNVFYDTYALSVSATGGFDLEVSSDFDSFLTVYGGSFDPTSPLANCLASNDDDGAGNDALINNVHLVAGIQYFAVVAGYEAGATGAYSLSASADLANTSGGTATLATTSVPEPGTLALLGLGFAGLAASLRRKK